MDTCDTSRAIQNPQKSLRRFFLVFIQAFVGSPIPIFHAILIHYIPIFHKASVLLYISDASIPFFVGLSLQDLKAEAEALKKGDAMKAMDLTAENRDIDPQNLCQV